MRAPIQNMESPEPLPSLERDIYTAAQKTQDVARYNQFVLSNDLDSARVMRDLVVHSVRREIESVYQAFEGGLFANRAAFDVETDVFELLLSTLTTVSTAQRARTNLSALLTGTKGTRLSVDKNVFGEKTYSALVQQMRASRSLVSARILEKIAKLGVGDYPLAEAEVDLVQLFNAGTLHEALIQLSAEAGKNAKEAAVEEKQAARAKLDLATGQQVDQITLVRSKFNQLFASKDVAAARKILKALDNTAKDDLPDQDVWDRLNEEIGKNSAKKDLPKLMKAFGLN